MRVTLSKSASYECVAQIRSIDAIPDGYELTIMGMVHGVANPEWRVLCRVITSRNNLRCLMMHLVEEVIDCECTPKEQYDPSFLPP